jgi:hypothetical protein
MFVEVLGCVPGHILSDNRLPNFSPFSPFKQTSIEVGENSIPMLANRLGKLAEGVEATTRCPATPPLEFSFGNLAFQAGVQ